MSSDIYQLTITALDGATLELTGTCWQNPNECAASRSFVLMALADVAPPALERALAAIDFIDRCTDPDFYAEYIDRFVVSAELVRQEGLVADEQAWVERRNAAYRALIGRGLEGDALAAAIAEQFPPPSFVVRATLTTPRFLAGLRVGRRWGTTAYEV